MAERPEKPVEPGPNASADEWNQHRRAMVAWHDWTPRPEPVKKTKASQHD
jgi:hypothetical protein